jgi:Coenzyme PQQ synthesis protein D (PqqD)
VDPPGSTETDRAGHPGLFARLNRDDAGQPPASGTVLEVGAGDTIYRRGGEVEAEPTEDGIRLHDPVRGGHYTLNAVGGRIWDLLDGRQTVGGIAVVVYDEFQVDWQTALADTEALVVELATAGLIVAD